ncbi:MAG: isochorismatase family protein, partial [Deltaproteobacteria bacterium]|nr:isochorismatase family protein [Deltaproteobacteria bacterium]
MPSILITQCLQRDFVEPVEAHEPLPNRLHVGHQEALRLIGHDPLAGPVAQVLRWARQQPAEELAILHVRDWHDATDQHQHDHLEMFGPHCLAGTPGAAVVLGFDRGVGGRPDEHFVDAVALNDFEGTTLPRHLERIRQQAGGAPIRIGVIGVWTEAKVSFLLYDLKTRGHFDELATCSALTASASRAQHFNALDQLRKILGVRVFDSPGEFAEWLVPASAGQVGRGCRPIFRPQLEVVGGQAPLAEADVEVLGFLFRDSARVDLEALSGGYSGALVFRAAATDALGQSQAPS